jgi:Flp pilus assembly protein TadG
MSSSSDVDSEQGAAAVEMALVLPLLLVFLVGIGDVGWMMWQRIQLQEAVQEGSIYGIFHPDQPGDVVNRVVAASDYTIDPSNVEVECSLPLPDSPRLLKVTVNQQHKLLMGILFDFTPKFSVSVTGDVMVDKDCTSSGGL